MDKKLGDLTLRELQHICDVRETCSHCPLNVLDSLCNCASSSVVGRMLDDIIEGYDRFYVEPEKNDSSANLEARIAKMEEQVAELWARYLK